MLNERRPKRGAFLVYPNERKIATISIMIAAIRLVIDIISIPMAPITGTVVNATLDIYFTPLMFIA